jgi:hypothetical protein
MRIGLDHCSPLFSISLSVSRRFSHFFPFFLSAQTTSPRALASMFVSLSKPRSRAALRVQKDVELRGSDDTDDGEEGSAPSLPPYNLPLCSSLIFSQYLSMMFLVCSFFSIPVSMPFFHFLPAS